MNQTTLSKLKELGELYKDGILSKEEFEEGKKQILSQQEQEVPIPPSVTQLNDQSNRFPSYPHSHEVYNTNHNPGYQYHHPREYYGGKSKSTAVVLAVLFGGTGIADFYLGDIGKGVLFLILSFIFWMITLFTLGFGFFLLIILWLVDFLPIVTMSEETFNRKYNHLR